jgi:hypothetical protein
MSKITVLLVLLMSVCIPTFAQNPDKPISAKYLIEFGVEYGGDEVQRVFFTDGSDVSMLAGQGAYLAAGGQFRFNRLPQLSVHATLGFKYSTTPADNANIMLTRFPVNIVPYWSITDDIRVGVGITTHQLVRLKGDDFVPDVDFTSSIGTRFEVAYKWVAATYTMIDYKNDANQKYAANAIGVSVSLSLPLQ